MRKIAIIIAAIVGTGLIAGMLFMADMKHYAKTPIARQPVNPPADGSPAMVFTVSPGDSFRSITRHLVDAGLVYSPFKFRLLARFNGHDKRIKTGEYRLTPSQSPGEILAMLVDGKVVLYRLTIPEGYNLIQIAHAVAAAGLAGTDDFLREAKNPKLIQSLSIAAPALEGYLFPDTYYFPRTVTPSTIIRTMVRRLNTVFTPKWKAAAKEEGWTVHQVLTLASIIEKETGDPAERELISSVFHNRLKKGMRLESDPTVIYGIPDFDGNLTRKHLRTPGPYNTYLNSGLPPGPIASPGAAAIKAALFPAKTRYLFFVARKDGTHQFSTHYAAHQQAVRKYQLSH